MIWKLPLVLCIVAAQTGAALGGENLLINGSMEYWHPSGLRPQGWGAWTPDKLRNTWRVFRDEEVVRDGKASMRVEVDDWVNLFAGSRVTGGEQYTWSIYARSDHATTMQMRFSVWGREMAAAEREGKARVTAKFDLEPNVWTRIHMTDTMPAGAERVMAYLFVRGAGVYHFDMGMLNRGELGEYAAGRHYDPIAPFGREPVDGETRFVPMVWDADGQPVQDQEAAFAFDRDLMSYLRLTALPASVGARFERPVMMRGVYLLAHEATLPENVACDVFALRDGAWRKLKATLQPVGATMLFSFEPQRVSAVRVRLSTTGEAPRKLRVYHMGWAQ